MLYPMKLTDIAQIAKYPEILCIKDRKTYCMRIIRDLKFAHIKTKTNGKYLECYDVLW